jgi:hypothetical protein
VTRLITKLGEIVLGSDLIDALSRHIREVKGILAVPSGAFEELKACSNNLGSTQRDLLFVGHEGRNWNDQ